jgi:hypothetical protein
VLSPGAATAAFDSCDWVAEIDAPSAVIVTARDNFIPAAQQWQLAKALAAEVLVIDGDYNVCWTRPDRFAACVVEACQRVFRHAGASSEPATA